MKKITTVITTLFLFIIICSACNFNTNNNSKENNSNNDNNSGQYFFIGEQSGINEKEETTENFKSYFEVTSTNVIIKKSLLGNYTAEFTITIKNKSSKTREVKIISLARDNKNVTIESEIKITTLISNEAKYIDFKINCNKKQPTNCYTTIEKP